MENRIKTFFSKMPFIKSLYNQAKYIFLSNMLEKAIFFVLFVVLARKLSTIEYGTIITVFAFSNILHSFFEFGFPAYFQRESASDSNSLNIELNSAFSLKLCGLTVFLGISLIYLNVINNISPVLVIIVGLSIYLLNTNVFFNSVIYGKGYFKSSFQGLLLSRVMFLALLGLYFFSVLQAEYSIVVLLLAAICHLVIIWRILRQNNLKIELEFDRFVLKKILKTSIPIGMGLIFVWLYDKIDVLFVQNNIGYDAVAIYSAAYSIYKLPQMVSGMVLVPVFSNLSRQFSKQEHVKKEEIIKTVSLLLFLLIAMLLFIIFLSEPIITIIYGSKYIPSSEYLIILVIALPGLILNNFTGVILNSIRREKLPLWATMIGAVINIILCFFLTKRWGIYGAVFATIITEYVVLLLEVTMLISLNSSKKVII